MVHGSWEGSGLGPLLADQSSINEPIINYCEFIQASKLLNDYAIELLSYKPITERKSMIRVRWRFQEFSEQHKRCKNCVAPPNSAQNRKECWAKCITRSSNLF